MAITWLGHATFVLRTPGGVELVIDPWLTTNPACPDDWKQIRRAEIVLVTHEWLGVRQVVPMHHGTFAQPTGTADQLRALVEPKGVHRARVAAGRNRVVRSLSGYPRR